MSEWRSMETAPRDGSFVELTCEWMRVPPLMKWDPDWVVDALSPLPGVWVTQDRSMFWSDHDPAHGPRQWRATDGAAYHAETGEMPP